MGFVDDIAGGLGVDDFFSDTFGGGQAADASLEAAALQAQASREALAELQRGKAEGQGFLSPFQPAGQAGLDNLGILTDPQQQFSFLQSNPLFKMALENANQQTMQTAAAGGRLSAGDTLQNLSNNVLLSAQPLLTQQQGNVSNLLNFGGDLARSQANTSLGVGSQLGGVHQDIGNSLAAGTIGASNAESQGQANLTNALLTGAAMFFSDSRLKKNPVKVGQRNGHNWYNWEWNELAEKLGLEGHSEGVMADEHIESGHVYNLCGYYCVDYKGLGVI